MTRCLFLLRRFLDRPSRVTGCARSSVRGWLSPRYKRNAVTLVSNAGGGLGDNLMVTTVAREVRKRNSTAAIHVITNFPEVFDRNPDVDFVSFAPKSDKAKFRNLRLGYSSGFPYKKHLVQYCCDRLDIRGAVDLRTYIYPSPEDWAWADSAVSTMAPPPILISRTAGSQAFRKTWPLESWKALVTQLLCLGPVIDIGSSGESLGPLPPQYSSLVGGTTVHQLAALTSRARALVSMDSAPVHLAAAFGVPTVCILGGVYPAVAIRYPNSKILTNRPACANCAPLRRCDYDATCLKNITVEDVLRSVEDLCPALGNLNWRNFNMDGGNLERVCARPKIQFPVDAIAPIPQ